MTYELVTIHLPESNIDDVQKQITDAVEELNGKVIDVDAWGERELVYQIKGLSRGSYTTYTIELDTEMVKKLQRELGFIEEIIRVRVFTKNK